jgi:hypothetical protein
MLLIGAVSSRYHAVLCIHAAIDNRLVMTQCERTLTLVRTYMLVDAQGCAITEQKRTFAKHYYNYNTMHNNTYHDN